MKLLDKVLLCLLSISVLLLTMRAKDLENKIEELEQRNLEAHEYILNRIGG